MQNDEDLVGHDQHDDRGGAAGRSHTGGVTVTHARGHAVLREANEFVVLRLISAWAPVSKAELVERSGLSRPTVLSIVAALEEQGLVVGHKAEGSGVGRAPLLYGPNPAVAFVVGVDLGGTKVRAALADMAGSVLAERVAPTDRRGGWRVVDQIAGLAHEVAADAGVPWAKVRGCTLGSPGVLTADGSIELAGNIRGLDRFDVQAALDERCGTPVRIVNDVNLAAVGEHAEGAGRGRQSLVLFAIGTGVGVGVISNGRLLAGARGRAGEIAYLPIGHDPADPAARERGAYEVAVSGSGFRSLAARTAGADRSGPEVLLEAAALGDPEALDVVERYAHLVACGVLSTVAVVDPEVVVLGGGIGSNPFLLGPIRAALDRIAPFPVPVELSRLGPRAGVVGAVTDARRTALAALVPVPDQLAPEDLHEVLADWGHAAFRKIV